MEKEQPSDAEVVSDGVLAMIAGSDTTSTVLSGLFCFMIASPECYKTLQKEIDTAFPIGEGDPFDAARLSELPYLNAVMWVLSGRHLPFFVFSCDCSAMKHYECNLPFRAPSSVHLRRAVVAIGSVLSTFPLFHYPSSPVADAA